MGEMASVRASVTWGEAEQAALDRCLWGPNRHDDQTSPSLLRLSRTIETEVIPRLMLAHREALAAKQDTDEHTISAAEVGAFVRTMLEGSGSAGREAVAAFRARGCSVETVLLHLLTPAARLLGDLWRDDLCSFADVTIGMSRLQQVLREVGAEFEVAGHRGQGGRILLAAAPGEQHGFGIAMVECFFRRAGWTVLGGGAASLEELLGIARVEWLDAIGVSLSGDVLYERTASAICALRAASRNPAVLMMAGGRFFCDHPDRAAELGIDVVAGDAPEALRLAHLRSGLVSAIS